MVSTERVRRVTFVIATLRGGGAERVMTLMANYWVEQDRHVTLIKLDEEAAVPAYALDSRVVLRSLDWEAVMARSAPKMTTLNCAVILKKMIAESRPDVVIAFMPEANTLARLATLGSRVPVIVMEHNTPQMVPIIPKLALLRRLTYPLASRVVLLHDVAKEYFSERVRRRAVVLPNPITYDAGELKVARAKAAPRQGAKVIAMGRLTEQKAFDVLIRAFARIASAHPNWSLDIWGDGWLREDLERQVADLHMADRIRLPGRTEQPLEKMCEADIFVLSSKFEGMPMVIGEAMAAGTPVVAFNCPTGPAEMIRHGIDGLLVPPEDEEALAASMDRLMDDSDLRVKMSNRAPEIMERYSLPKVMQIWEDLLAEVAR